MTSLLKGVLRGAGAGAAGTTALNLTTNADMAIRGRPASHVPQAVVSEAADRIGLPVPGSIPGRRHRLDGLGALAGAANGVAVGALAGALRATGVRLPAVLGAPLLGAASMLATDLPIAGLGVSAPRSWSARDWMADAVPHLVYGVVTHATLVSQDSEDDEDGGSELRSPSAADLGRAVALGAATGCRSAAGVTALALRSTPGDAGAAGHLAGRTSRTLLGLLAVGELGGDKHPSAPGRVSAPGLAPRVALGAASCGATARRDGVQSGVPALLGAATAAGTAVAGMRARAAAQRRFGSDLPGALAEDAVAGLLAWAGTRRRNPGPGRDGIGRGAGDG